MNKAVETGLKATGRIGEGALGQRGSVTVQQVIIIPQLPANAEPTTDALEIKSVTEKE